MKKILIPIFGALTLLVITGCPVGIAYPLAEPGSGSIDKKLVGTWVCNSEDSEVKRVKISKKDDKSYSVDILEKGSMYSLETDHLKGWVTTLDGATFLFLRPDGEENYYHYQYKKDGESFVTNDVSLLDGGIDAVTSTESLREQVSSSMKMNDWGKETQSWIKE
jgi:hypothetical protein